MRVLIHDPYLHPDRAKSLGAELGTLDQVLAEADVLSVHVPLTDGTTGLIGAAQLARLKKSAFVLNVARGEIIDEAALIEALRAGTIAGAGLDVYNVEPLPADHPFRSLDNAVLTPHLGASTEEAQQNVALEISAAVRAALLEGDLSRAVNAPGVGGERMRRLQAAARPGRAAGPDRRRAGRRAPQDRPGAVRRARGGRARPDRRRRPDRRALGGGGSARRQRRERDAPGHGAGHRRRAHPPDAAGGLRRVPRGPADGRGREHPGGRRGARGGASPRGPDRRVPRGHPAPRRPGPAPEPRRAGRHRAGRYRARGRRDQHRPVQRGAARGGRPGAGRHRRGCPAESRSTWKRCGRCPRSPPSGRSSSTRDALAAGGSGWDISDSIIVPSSPFRSILAASSESACPGPRRRRPGPGAGATTRHHRFPHLGRAGRPGRVCPRRALPPQFRVCIRRGGVPGGPAARAGLRPRVLGRGDDPQPPGLERAEPGRRPGRPWPAGSHAGGAAGPRAHRPRTPLPRRRRAALRRLGLQATARHAVRPVDGSARGGLSRRCRGAGVLRARAARPQPGEPGRADLHARGRHLARPHAAATPTTPGPRTTPSTPSTTRTTPSSACRPRAPTRRSRPPRRTRST